MIEDAAQAMGAERKGQKAGSWGDTGCLSFFPSQNLGAYGDGGMVATNSREVANRIRSLSQHGKSDRLYSHQALGLNSRLDSIQAAVLRVKLPHLDEWNRRRQHLASLYNRLLKRGRIDPPFCHPDNTHIYNQYPIRLSDRGRVMKKLIRSGIPARVYCPIPVHLQEVFRYLGYREGDLPESEEAAKTVLSLPIHSEMSEEEIRYIASKVVDTISDKK